jgi:hypothetical protein
MTPVTVRRVEVSPAPPALLEPAEFTVSAEDKVDLADELLSEAPVVPREELSA